MSVFVKLNCCCSSFLYKLLNCDKISSGVIIFKFILVTNNLSKPFAASVFVDKISLFSARIFSIVSSVTNDFESLK